MQLAGGRVRKSNSGHLTLVSYDQPLQNTWAPFPRFLTVSTSLEIWQRQVIPPELKEFLEGSQGNWRWREMRSQKSEK